MSFIRNRLSIISLLILTVAVFAATVCFFLYYFSPKAKIFINDAFSIVEEKNYVQLMFVGDLMFDRGIRYYASLNGGNDFIFREIRPTLLENDLVVANLEGPITDNLSLSSGTAPGSANNYYFTFDPGLAQTLFQNNIGLVSLGNNHILNFGQAGATSTQKYLDMSGVDYFGAPDRSRSILIEVGDIKITFINYNEFSGVPVEAQATIEEIQKVRTSSDLIIIYGHWGEEYIKTPSENIRNLAHQFIDEGADLVIGSHPHVIVPMEIYKDKRIYYSLGNFIFDQYFSEDVRNGLGVIMKINKKTKELNFEEKNLYLQGNGQTVLLK